MDNIQLETIRQNFFCLFHGLDIESLVIPLFEKGVMPTTFIELLQHVTNKYQKRMMFLLEIQRHSCEAWEYLLQSLIESDQSEIASKLAETYFALASTNSEFSTSESTHEKQTKSKRQSLHFVKNILQKLKATITFQKEKPNSTNPFVTRKEMKTSNDNYSGPLKKKNEVDINSEISTNLDSIKERADDTHQYFHLQDTLEQNLYNFDIAKENILDICAVSESSDPILETVQEKLQTQCFKNADVPISNLHVTSKSKQYITLIIDKTNGDTPKENTLNIATELKSSEVMVEASEKLQPTFQKSVDIPYIGLDSNPAIEEEINDVREKTIFDTSKENISGASESFDLILEEQEILQKHYTKNIDIHSIAFDFNPATDQEINVIDKRNFDTPNENMLGIPVALESSNTILEIPQKIKTHYDKNADMSINALDFNPTTTQENTDIENTNFDTSNENISGASESSDPILEEQEILQKHCTKNINIHFNPATDQEINVIDNTKFDTPNENMSGIPVALESSNIILEIPQKIKTHYDKNTDMSINALDFNPITEQENTEIEKTNVNSSKENISDIPVASESSNPILEIHKNLKTHSVKNALNEQKNNDVEKTNFDIPKENVLTIPEALEFSDPILESSENLMTHYIKNTDIPINALDLSLGQENTNIEKTNFDTPKENVLDISETSAYSDSMETLEDLEGHCVKNIDINELDLSPITKLKISDILEKTTIDTPKENILDISIVSECSDSFLESTKNLETCTKNGDILNIALDLNPVTKRKISNIIEKRKPSAVFFNDYEECSNDFKEQNNSWSSNSFQFDSTPKKKFSLPSLTKKKFLAEKNKSYPNSKDTSLEDLHIENMETPRHCSGIRNIFRKISQSSKHKRMEFNKSRSMDELDFNLSADSDIKLTENNSTTEQGNKSETFDECSI